LSVNSESTPPRGYVPIDTAAQILTDGGTIRALTFAATFLRLVVDNQGAPPWTPVPRLRWWQRDRSEPLYVNMREIPGLRGEFGRLLADHLSADEWGPPVPTGVGTAVAALPKYREGGKAECYQHLLELMKSGLPVRRQDKNTLRRILAEQFKISGNSFDDSWSRALDDAGARPKPRPNHDA
jgi:hypothetical protein